MASINLPAPKYSQFQLFVKTQFQTKPRPPPESTSLVGQTAIVTGSNIGIGYECVRKFLDLGLSHAILAVRSVKKGEQAAVQLRKAHPKAKIEIWPLDMLSYDSIQKFAQRCATLQRLDIAVLNAAVGNPNFRINPSTGHEEAFQVNYLSTALLATLLLPVLKAKSPPNTPGRLSLVSSGLALIAPFANRDAVPLIPSFDDPKGWNLSAASDRYSTTKTMVLELVLKLSAYVSAEDVIVNAVDPGYTAGTGLDRNAPGWVKPILRILKSLAARSTKQAAWTYVDAAAVRGAETHGSFVMNWEIYP